MGEIKVKAKSGPIKAQIQHAVEIKAIKYCHLPKQAADAAAAVLCKF